MYDPHSLHAEEFIDHEEVQETLAWAAEHARDAGLIDSILAKAALCKGLSHREASVLLACELPDRVEALYRLANRIKHEFYGNRIVMFAPLYLSNYCVNSCVYCPYHARNKHIIRKKLTQEEVAREVIALQDKIPVERNKATLIRIYVLGENVFTTGVDFEVEVDTVWDGSNFVDGEID